MGGDIDNHRPERATRTLITQAASANRAMHHIRCRTLVLPDCAGICSDLHKLGRWAISRKTCGVQCSAGKRIGRNGVSLHSWWCITDR